jgi:hypothetical protein
MKILIALSLFLFTIFASTIQAATILDGNALLKDLEITLRSGAEPHGSQADALVAAHTRGWISGLLQGINLGTQQGAKCSFRVPAGLPVEEVMRALVKFLSAHPDRLQQSPAKLANDALTAAYPKHGS